MNLRFLLLSLINVLVLESASATSFFTDQFSYTDGADLGAASGGGGATWTLASGDTSQIQVSAASAQTSPSGYAAAAGLGVVVTPTTSRKQTGVPFNGTTGIPVADGNVVYASFLLNVQILPSATMRVAYMHNSAASQGGIEVVVSSTGQVGVQKKGSGTTFVSGTPVANTNTTHLVVMRYTFQSGNDEVAVWVDPASTSYGVNPAPTTGAFAATTGGGSDMSSAITYFIIDSPGLAGPVFWIDEVRVGTTWADVTPASGSTNLTGVPIITQALLTSQGMILRGSNGPSSSTYQVLASTNITLSLSNWPSIASHSFDVVGNFDSTNPVTAGLKQQFFRLLIGTNSSVATAPSITTQPQSFTVAVGATANFLVGVSGDAPLAYFWSFNTNTPVGGNSNTLALVNVQTTNAGSYRVIVTNSAGTATSSAATLTVLIPPTITANPTNLTVAAGGSAAFNVTATGSALLSYQWYFNTNTALANATNATLTLNSVNSTNAGTYSVIVTNLVGAATSSVALFTVLGSPVITTQPQSLSVAVSNNATFTVTASGTATLNYQWFFNTNTAVGGNSNNLALLNVQTTNAGTYSVIITNNYGAVTSSFATLTVSTSIVNYAQFNLEGFAQSTTGGGVIATNNSAYVQVYTPLDFANALQSAAKTTGSVKVVEIMTNLNLGWNEVGATVQAVGPFRANTTPLLHPVLLTVGESLIDIVPKSGLTIFSANGVTIKHCNFNIKGCSNVIVRNLKFDENFEWDENTKGQYDRNDWDFITVGNGGSVSNLWVDHCTFTKSYDGILDTKAGCSDVTISWCKYMGDDGATNTNSWLWQQINYLEQSSSSYPMYNFLRTHGYSTTNIVTIMQAHDKTHLAGQNDLDPNNATIAMTFHHLWIGVWDRCVPRLRAGNVHDFNIYVDDTLVLAARRLRDSIAANLSSADQNTLNNTYSFEPPVNGTISTESGAILVEKSAYIDCLWPLRNNQTDPTNPAYTGKIMALDSIYHFDYTDSTTTDFRGNNTNAPGNTYFGPAQATIIPFAWNTNAATPNGQLPYTYTMDDPSNLQSIVTSPTLGAGAGVLTWNKTNWMKTSY